MFLLSLFKSKFFIKSSSYNNIEAVGGIEPHSL